MVCFVATLPEDITTPQLEVLSELDSDAIVGGEADKSSGEVEAELLIVVVDFDTTSTGCTTLTIDGDLQQLFCKAV
jgi:hypothetical protein